MLEATIITLLTTLTLLQCFIKWGWVDKYAAYRRNWMPEADCYLCLAFWISMPVAGLYFFAKYLGIEWAFIPFACAGLVNFIGTFLQVLKK